MNILKEIVNALVELMNNMIDIAKKTGAVFFVLGFIIVLGWSIITTLTGWYYIGIEESVKAFLVLCLCIGIIMHIGEKRGDNIGGKSNESNDSEIREDT